MVYFCHSVIVGSLDEGLIKNHIFTTVAMKFRLMLSDPQESPDPTLRNPGLDCLVFKTN